MTKPTSPHYSLRTRLTIVMAVGFLIVLSIISLGLWAHARNSANQTYDLLLEGASIVMEERLSVVDGEIIIDLPPAAHEILTLSRNDRVFYHLFDSQGKTITGNHELPPPPPVDEDRNTQFYDGVYDGSIIRFSTRYSTLISVDINETVGIQIGQTRDSRNALQWDIFLKGLVGLVTLAIVSLLFSRLAITRALKPLLGVEAEIAQMDPLQSKYLKAQPPREIGSLIRAINLFMLRLRTSRENAEQFIADVAHQMRTSLSTVAGHFQAARDIDDPKKRLETYIDAEHALKRTINSTNQLLSHAMIMYRHEEVEYGILDLEKTVRQAIERSLSADIQNLLEFDFRMEDDLCGHATINGDEVAIKEAIDNVIANAVQHTRRLVSIQISISRTSGPQQTLVLKFEDDGPGLTKDQADLALQRFTALGPNAGSGLGLSIVADVVKNHGGELRLGQSCLGGLSVELRFPENKQA
ncbi:histidine kinase (plasmid) [Maritalea myrionectae]|uniref:histidine kinase n=1 Tax=Maritalea myrionectae TaxID=454601 RepID=A0A2R4MJA0_9HYPH|nr:sensor histidine kinase [Maritalea myrionectae]AVX06058.1 histidine kinase [Maritalea myrionectae]